MPEQTLADYHRERQKKDAGKIVLSLAYYPHPEDGTRHEIEAAFPWGEKTFEQVEEELKERVVQLFTMINYNVEE